MTVGTLKHLPKTCKAFHLAILDRAPLGSYDGEIPTLKAYFTLLISKQTLQGVIHDFGGLFGGAILRHSHEFFPYSFVAMRWMLGAFEAGLFPGANYYMSW